MWEWLCAVLCIYNSLIDHIAIQNLLNTLYDWLDVFFVIFVADRLLNSIN